MGCCQGQQSVYSNNTFIKPNKLLVDSIKEDNISDPNSNHKISLVSKKQQQQISSKSFSSNLTQKSMYKKENLFNKNNNVHNFHKKSKQFIHGVIHPENESTHSNYAKQIVNDNKINDIFKDRTNIPQENINNSNNINKYQRKQENNISAQAIFFKQNIDISKILTDFSEFHNQDKFNNENSLSDNTKRQYLLLTEQLQIMLNSDDQKKIEVNMSVKDNYDKEIQAIWGQQVENVNLKHQKQQKFHINLQKVRKKSLTNDLENYYNDNLPQFQSNQDDSYSRCLLSDPSRFLNDSILTEKQLQKQQFYQNFNNINSKVSLKFEKWSDIGRQPFIISESTILKLLVNQKYYVIATLISQVLRYYEMCKINLISYVNSQKQRGWRFFFNGIKRLLPVKSFNINDLPKSFEQGLNSLPQSYLENVLPSQLFYNLTGWIPEQIVLKDVTNIQGILERLNTNFRQGNTIITFTKYKQDNQSKYILYGLKDINLVTKLVTVYSFNDLETNKNKNEKKSLKDYQVTIQWNKFIEHMSSIHVNWNPTIYQFTWKAQNIVHYQGNKKMNTDQPNSLIKLDSEYISSSSNQFLIKIPSYSDDIELRLFLEAHYQLQQGKNIQDQLIVQLYDYSNGRINSSRNCIRRLNKNKIIFSDVFVFEASSQKNQYVLVIRSQRDNYIKYIHYTFSVFSFFQIGFSELSMERIKSEKIIESQITEEHTGYGINSPYFLNNLCMQLNVPSEVRLKIFAIMPDEECHFQLCMISNPNNHQNLTRFNLQTILNDILCTQQLQEKGYLEIQTKTNNYFLMINNYSKCKGKLKIVMQIIQNKHKSLNQTFWVGDKLQNSLIEYKQVRLRNKAIHTKEFKWQPLNSGPRKRLKSNTNSQYQNSSVFKQFFQNPFIDFQISNSQKQYQFSVENLTYKQCFDSIQQVQDKQDLQPPTLSLSILKIGQNEKTFKIVLDDAFYVPFGFGFWSKILKLEKGMYRFIFPKMEKEKSRGKFSVFEIK